MKRVYQFTSMTITEQLAAWASYRFHCVVLCRDAVGDEWQLTSQAPTAKEAAEEGWIRFRDHRNWHNYGQKIPSTEKAKSVE